MSTTSLLSDRGRSLPASPIRRLHPYAVAARKRGIHIHHLNIGQPDVPTPPQMLERLKHFDEPVVAYGPSQGLPEFIETMLEYYRGIGYDFNAGNLIVTTGGSEAILMALTVLTDPGDEILVAEPFYSNYNSFAAITRNRIVPFTTSIDDGFHLPPKSDIVAKISDRTKVMLVCSPNNPTGTVLTEEEVRMLVEIAVENDLIILTDEPYREIVYDGREMISPMRFDKTGDRVVLVDSLSKRYSACGARIGCLVTRNAEIYDAALRFGMARLCPPTIAQHMAMGAIELAEDYNDVLRSTYRARRDAVMSVLDTTDEIIAKPPEGAFYVIAKLPVASSQDFCRWLLEDFESGGETVMLAPADGFYATPGLGLDEVRIACVLKPELMERSMHILLEALDTYKA